MLQRRTLLGSVVATAAMGLPGCSGQPGDDGTVTGTDEGPADAPSITGATLESETPESGETSSATITKTEDGIAVSGQIVAPTPCYLAELAEQSVENSTAQFRIDIRENQEADLCQQVISVIPFEMTATLENVDAVVVELNGNEPDTYRADLN